MGACRPHRNSRADFDEHQTPAPTKSPGAAHPRGKPCGERNDHSAKHEYIARSHLRKVKLRRFALFAISAIATIIVLILAASAYWERKQRLFDNPPDLFAAVRAFCSDQARHGQVPAEVSLQDLLKGGYVSSNEARAFEGFEVTFSTRYSDDAPQVILARALAPDGQSICLLADGSVQQLSAQKYSDYLKSSAQTGTMNSIEKSRPETNVISTTNGLRREPDVRFP